MDRMKNRGGLVVLAVITALVAAGCTGGATGGDKAGGPGEPVVLKMAEGPIGNSSTTPSVEYFVKRVGELSGGALRIQDVSEWSNGQPEAEQKIVADVAAGKADLAPVGTRVFDTLGVTSFQALTAPMLIDNYALENAVIASDIPAQMLRGLDASALGVTGLAVLGDGLRKPVAVKQPLLGPADWQGVRFAVFRSQGEAAAIRALGARPTEMWGGPLSTALADGSVQGAENSLLIYQDNSRERSTPYVTANVNLWPRTVALVANPKSVSSLTDQQQGWLRQAAAEAATRSTSMFDQDQQIVATECEAGARFANASQADLAALRSAFAPVYATLEQDPQTKGYIDSIQQLKQTTPAGLPLIIPTSCTGAAVSTTSDPLAGTWQSGKLTENQIVRAFIAAGGSERVGHAFFAALGGGSTQYAVITISFQDGMFTEHESGDGGAPVQGGSAIYDVANDGTLTITDPAAGCTSMYRPDVTGETLRLHLLNQCAGHDGPFGTTLIASYPFTKSS